MAQYKIGRLKLKTPYFLAPMAGINDIAFRILCRNAGAGLAYTGMINPLSRAKRVLDDKPAVQLVSASEKGISEFIKKSEKAVLYDFNLGCSVKKAESKRFGVFLHSKTETIRNILGIMRESTKKPVTIKLRKSDEAFKILKIAEEYCDAVCIHARTSNQGYSGKADIDFAEKLKQKSSIPVIYSGDVNESNADVLLKKFDFVMIGRQAMGYPNIFANLTGKKPIFGFPEYLKLALKYKLKFQHIKSQAICFTKFLPKAGELRMRLTRMNNIDELKAIAEEGCFER
ncbi:MAG: tRNA-dihydrouridine synthase family protein [archaeon]